MRRTNRPQQNHYKRFPFIQPEPSNFRGPYLVLNHAADLRQEVLADDTVEVAVLGGGFVLDALCQTDPLFLCFTHKGPGASLIAWHEKQREAHG